MFNNIDTCHTPINDPPLVDNHRCHADGIKKVMLHKKITAGSPAG